MSKVIEAVITRQLLVQETELGVVEVLTPGPQGPTGDKARRHDWTGTYDYLGTAPVGTAENAAAWRIVRLTINAAGAVTANQSATSVTWTGRAGHTYS